MADRTCPSREEIAAYLSNSLDEVSSDRLAAHVEDCQDCQATLQTLCEFDDTLLDELRAPVEDSPFVRESECERAVERAAAEASRSLAARDKAAGASDALPAVLAQLREYQAFSLVKEGGMGTVYRAVQSRLGRTVAIKLLSQRRMSDPQARARFEREIQLVGKLRHPHIVQAYDAREIDGTLLLVMEFLEGLSLGDVLQNLGALPVADACELVRQAALGLSYAHTQGLIHRDVKPSNLMLDEHGQVKVLDLGLARLRSDDSTSGDTTSSGQLMGTADYIAPEQVHDAHEVDARADIYSLGCTLYALLAGRAPFETLGRQGSHVAKMMAHLEKEPTAVRRLRADVPAGLAELLKRMMAKNPESRLATAAEVVEALSPFTDGADLPALLARARAAQTAKEQAKPVTPDSPRGGDRDSVLPAAQRRRPIWTAVAVAAALFGIIALGVIIRIRYKDGRETVIHAPDDAQIIVERDTDVASKPVHTVPPAKPDQTATPVQPPTGTDKTSVAMGEPIGSNTLVMSPAVLSVVKAWTIETREDRAEVLALAYSPDGKWLASGGGDGAIRIRKSDTGEVVRVFRGQDAYVYCLAWSPDGQFLASCGKMGDHAGTVEVWHVESARVTYSHSVGNAFTLAWSPDSKSLIYSGHHYTAGALDVLSNSSEPTWVIDDRGAPIVWSPDSRTFLAQLWAKEDNHTEWHQYDRETGQALDTVVPVESVHEALSMPDGKLLIKVSVPDADCDKVCLFDPISRKMLREHVSPVERPARPWNFGSLSPDGRVCAEFNGGEFCIWETETGKPVMKIPPPVLSWAWSPDARAIAVAAGTKITAHELPSGKPLFERPGIQHEVGEIVVAEISPDGRSIAVGLPDKTYVCDLTDAASAPASIPLGVDESWGDLLWSPSGKKVAIAGQGQLTIRSGDLQTRYATFDEPAPGMYMHPSAWSADEKQLAIGTLGGGVLVYAEGQDQLDSLEGPAGSAHFPVWSPGQDQLATNGSDGQVHLWDMAAKKLTRSIDARTAISYVYRGPRVDVRRTGAPVWSPDGRFLAVFSDENKAVTMVEVASGQVYPMPLEVPDVGHGREIVFSPDSRLLAAAFHGAEFVWDTASRKRITSFPVAIDAVRVGFSPDSERLFVLGGGHRVFMSEFGIEFRRQLHTSLGPIGYCRHWDWNRTADIGIRTDSRPDGSAARRIHAVSLWRLSSGAPLGTIAFLRDTVLYVNAEGHYRSSSPIDDDLVYLVQTDKGQETLSAAEFSQRFGWQNDPAKVQLSQ